MMRLAWWISVVLSIGAYVAVIMPAHRAIAGLELEARSLYDSANRDERLVERGPMIGNAERRVQRMIARLGGSGDTDALLEMLDRESAECHIRVSGVTPNSVGLDARKASSLRSAPLTIELEGRFSEILALLGRLGDAAPLVGIDSIALTPVRAMTHGSPTLHVTLTVQLYVLAADWQKGRPDESAGALR